MEPQLEQTTTPDAGGYEYNFLDPPHSRYICIICQLPSRDPYMTGNCCRGQILCKPCLDRACAGSTTNSSKCPICHKDGFVSYPNWHLDREIKSLFIYCTNKEKGCKWCGELYDISNHLGNNSDGCQFEEVKCYNGCGKIMQRQCMPNHVKKECPNRKSECQLCHIIGEHEFIEGKHKQKCPRLPIPCPNNCDVGEIPRESMEAHRKECPLEINHCEYHDVGCKVMVVRKDEEKHKEEKMEEHLVMTKLELNCTKVQIADALQRINNLEVVMHLVTDKAIARPTSSATAINSSVNWYDKLTAMAKMSKSGFQICPVVLKLSEINKRGKSKNATNSVWYSDSFYTHNRGYKVCLHININGYREDRETYLSVWLHLMEGEYDDELTWPLTGMFKIMLLNQINDSEHYREVVVYNENTHAGGHADRVIRCGISVPKNGWGKQKFISYKDLHRVFSTCRFLKDDSVFFQVDFYNTTTTLYP